MYILLSCSFCLKNRNVKYLDCVSAKSTQALELGFGYVVGTSMFRYCAKNCTELLKGSFYINYLVILINLPR
jgi:hypothetical protein